MRRRIGLALAAAATLAATLVLAAPSALAGAGCHDPQATDGESTRVELVGNCFSPTVTRISAGGEVTFFSSDDVPHTVSGLGYTWGTRDDLTRGQSARFTFADEGIFPYACNYHPGMVGAVVVGDGVGTLTAALPEPAVPKADPPAGAGAVAARPAAGTSDVAAWWPVLAIAIAAGGALAGFVGGRRTRRLGREDQTG